jgi:hypothetical protein
MRHMHHFYEASENNLHSHIGRGFPLFTELPRTLLLGKSPSPGPIGPGSTEPYPPYRTGC